MLCLSSFRSAWWSAFRLGGFVGVRVRASRRSPSGAVAVFVFSGRAAALVFARRWHSRLGSGAVVRPVAGRFAVSLPLAFHSGAAPRVPRFFPAGGGVRAAAAVVPIAASSAAVSVAAWRLARAGVAA